MENTETAERNVVLQLNGVSVDVDVILKDAEIELNNNDAIKDGDETVQSRETVMEKSKSAPAAETDQDEQKRDESSAKGSMDTDNGTETNAHNEQSGEGDSKVDQSSDNETDATTEASVSSSISGTESKDDNRKDTKSSSSSGTFENVGEKMGTKSNDASEQRHEEKVEQSESTVTATATNDDEHRDSDAKEKLASRQTDADAKINENKLNEEKSNEEKANEKKSNDEKTNEEKANEEKTDEEKLTEEKTDDQTASGSEAAQNGSPKKAPKKKSSKKRRTERARTQQTDFDYSDLDNYTVSVSQRQRRYFLVTPRGQKVPVPGDDCEVFCSNIPINVLEGELIPLFERYGKIWELRLMMSMRNPKRNAGFAFVRFTSNTSANETTEKLNEYEIVPGKHLSVRLSQPNLSLFVGNIHRSLTREQIHEKIGSRTNGLMKTFVKSSLYEDTKNCGFCFLEYDSHANAVHAKSLLKSGNVWGRQLFVDWAQRRKQPDESEVNDSKTLFVNYLPKETSDEQITEALGTFGTIEKVTKIKDYAFVLFTEHQAATDAMNGADKAKLGNEAIEISLAIPRAMKSPRTRRPSFTYSQPGRPYRRRRNQSFNRYEPTVDHSNSYFMSNRRNRNKRRDHAGTATEQTTMPATEQTTTERTATSDADAATVQQTLIPDAGQTIIPVVDAAISTFTETLVN